MMHGARDKMMCRTFCWHRGHGCRPVSTAGRTMMTGRQEMVGSIDDWWNVSGR